METRRGAHDPDREPLVSFSLVKLPPVSTVVSAMVRLPVHMPVLLPVHLSILLPVRLAVLLPVRLPILLSVRLAICLPIGLAIFLSDIRLGEGHIRQDGRSGHGHDDACDHSGF